MKLLIAGCWLIFVGYWLATWSSSKPTAVGSGWRRPGWHLALLTAGAMSFAIAFAGISPDLCILGAGPARTLAAGRLVAGLGLAVWARNALGANWSPAVNIKHDHELITRGPYSLVRHPIYTSMLLMFLGSSIGLGRLDGFLGWVLCTASFWVKLRDGDPSAAAVSSRVPCLLREGWRPRALDFVS